MSRSSHSLDSIGTETAPRISADIVSDAVANALRRWVGPNKPVLLDELAERTGWPRRTLNGYRDGEPAPFWKVLLIAHHLGEFGPPFLNEIVRTAGFIGVQRARCGGVNPRDLAADLAGLTASINDKLRDGKLDHCEKAQLGRELDRELPKLQEAREALRVEIKAVV